MKAPKTLQEAIQFFADFDNCREFMIAVRWPDGKIRCPVCGSEKIAYLVNARLYKCNEEHPRQKFSLKVGTVFEDSPIPLEKWLPAVWLLATCKNGVSSYEISRALGVTQKTAWFMLHRIRLAMQSKSFMKLGGSGAAVEVDETFIGGKSRNMHRDRRIKIGVREHNYGKTVVMGLLERGGDVAAQIIPRRKAPIVQKIVRELVEPGSTVMTDDFNGYLGIAPEYEHQVVNHLEQYVRGNVHTQGIENFWSLLKRSLGGTYVSVEPFHLFRYVDEQVFRYNNRATKKTPMTDADRFIMAMSQIVGRRLTYAEVTGKVGETIN